MQGKKGGSTVWLDIAIGIILIISVIWGYQRGFVQTLLHTAGWLMAVVIGLVFYPKVYDILIEKTNIYDTVHTLVVSHFIGADSTIDLNAVANLPAVFGDMIQTIIDMAADTLEETLTNGLTELILKIIAFVAVAVVIRAVFFTITLLFSKKSNDGITGMIDGLAGGLFGAVRGLVIVYLLLALLVPLLGFENNSFLVDSLSNSIFSKLLYDNNLLFYVFHYEIPVKIV